MRRCLLLLIIVFACYQRIMAIMYDREDSIQVVRLLQKGAEQPEGTNFMLWYAHQFMSTPYVAHTLEVGDSEDLIINLSSLDCTTLVENVTALSLATKNGGRRWQDFVYWLQRIRYRDGKLDGYSSRNHYFTQWIESNERQGLVEEVCSTVADKHYPFTVHQTISLHYMTDHPEAYPALKYNAEERNKIGALERSSSGKKVRYIPLSLLGKSQQQLKHVHDGDIIAVVTQKNGLDVSHVGIAAWCKDGKLHLLNASKPHRRVILDTVTLESYVRKYSHRLGIRVIRLK